jgi:hypothetical protein
VLVLSNCDPARSEDCNGNGRADLCDVQINPLLDCDRDGVPDSCAIASGAADDCDGNGKLDSCPDCPGIEVVFVVDTSTSMEDEGAVLCNGIRGISAQLRLRGYKVLTHVLGNEASSAARFPCLEDSVPNRYGSTLPGSPPASVGTDLVAACPGNPEVASESWAPAAAIAAARHPWASGVVRLVVPLADEGPWCGDPVSNPGPDADSIPWAAGVAQAAGVRISPLTGTGSAASMVAMARDLAERTGGTTAAISNASTDLQRALEGIVASACDVLWDCDGSGRADLCELAEGAPDCNGNDRIDSCDLAEGRDAGVCGTP